MEWIFNYESNKVCYSIFFINIFTDSSEIYIACVYLKVFNTHILFRQCVTSLQYHNSIKIAADCIRFCCEPTKKGCLSFLVLIIWLSKGHESC